jgi:4a-hydroxytetrahydrobiopterin dehydratase
MATVISPAQFSARRDLPDWRCLLGGIEATFRLPSFSMAAELVVAIARASDDAKHHPDVDLRYPGRVHVTLTTHAEGGAITDLDLDLAATISQLAADSGAISEVATNQLVEIAIDALDTDAVRPFWKAVLGYADDARPGCAGQVVALKDPLRLGPAVRFQLMNQPLPQGSRFHLDVTVSHDVADARVAAALEAGGRLVTDEYAPSWWVLADPEGNQARICTWQDRD